MSAIGPVEPGQGTYDSALQPPPEEHWSQRLRRRLAGASPRARRAALAAVIGCALLAGLLARLSYTSATSAPPRPPRPPAPSRPAARPAPFPSQTVSMTYAGSMSHPSPGDGNLRFAVVLTNELPDHRPVPAVTVLRISQPSPALSVTISPRLPLGVKSGTPRRAVITMLIRECAKAPRNDALPFLDVTLRNSRAKEQLSFILGYAYATDLSAALTAACPQPGMS